MFDVGFMELVLVSVIGLLVLGPQRLPKVAAEVGKWIGRARRTATQLRRQLEREIELSELQTPPVQPPPSPQAPPGQPLADAPVPRSGDVPPGPGTHADPPDSSASASTIGQPQPTTSTDSPEPPSAAPEWGASEHVEGSDNAKN
jgi:sec-independent protein translocase protein TatB